MSVICDIEGYTTSRDYAALWELAQKQSVVCVVDYDWRDGTKASRDIAQTIASPWSIGGMDNRITIGVRVRGIEYAGGKNCEQFVASCERCNLEWLIPGKLPVDEFKQIFADQTEAFLRIEAELQAEIDQLERQNADIIAVHDKAVAEFQRVDALNRELLGVLETAVKAAEFWYQDDFRTASDAVDCLMAIAGRRKRYTRDLDDMHAAIAKAKGGAA